MKGIKIKMIKVKSYLLLAVISFILLHSNFTGNITKEVSFENTRLNLLNYPIDAVNHNPIYIDGNDELATFIESEDLSGDGTYVSPYVIEGFTINASTEDGIFINNTDANLIIRDCTVEGGNRFRNDGIHLSNTTNVIISNNELIYNHRGIYLDYSSNNILSGNNASYNNYGVVLQDDSNNNTIYGNNASYNNDGGFWLGDSNNSTIYGNNASYNPYGGISLWESSNNTISGNNVVYNGYSGLHLYDSSNNTISGNNANNNDDGLHLKESSNNTISGNNANYNNIDGIYLRESSNNTISWNNANNNEYGIYLYYYCDNNTIYYNDIWGNQNHQAYEGYEYRDNHWDNGIIGNYWGNDYIIKNPDATNDETVWDTPYEIHGTGLGIDYFPLVNSIYLDFEAPIITNVPGDLSTYEGYSGLNITWIVADLDPATYTIELNGTEAVSGTVWASGTAISYYIPDGLLENDYNITIIVSDESGNIAQDTVIFSVIHTSDFDEDGMPDSWEEQYNLNPLNASDAEDDPDGDGLTNLEEYLLGLNPRDRDTDNDGIPDNIDLFPNSFFMPTGLIITIFGSVGIIYAIFKIIKKERR